MEDSKSTSWMERYVEVHDGFPRPDWDAIFSTYSIMSMRPGKTRFSNSGQGTHSTFLETALH